MQAVHGIDGVENLRGLARLVGLQMADESPADPCREIPQFAAFGRGGLDPAFADLGNQAGGDDLADLLWRCILGHDH